MLFCHLRDFSSFGVAGRHCHEPGQIQSYGPIYQSSWHRRQSRWLFLPLPPLNENTTSADFFQNQLSGISSVSNSLDPDKARHFVGPDLGANCYQQPTQVGKVKS